MSYALYDSTGPLAEFASIGGYADFRDWAQEQGAPLRRFVHFGFTEDLEGLRDALEGARPPKSLEEQRNLLQEYVAVARDVLIVSDGMADDDQEFAALGGQGSGNFGHAGRPGEVGGSAPDAAGETLTPEEQYEKDKKEYLTPGEYAKLPPGIVKWKVMKRKAEAEAKAKAAGPKVEPPKVEPPKVEPPKVEPPKVELPPSVVTVGQREKAISEREHELGQSGKMTWSEARKQARAEDRERFGEMPPNSLHKRTEAIYDRIAELRSKDAALDTQMKWEDANKIARAEDVDKHGPWVQPEDVAARIASDKTWSVTSALAADEAPTGELLSRPKVDPIEHTIAWRRMTGDANNIAAQMGHDPSLIVVRDYEGRTFQLNGQTLTEGGHYSPGTGYIELNAAKGIDEGTIIHEIQHAQFDYVRGRAAEEETALRTRWAREQADDFRGTRYFTKDGKVLAKYRKEVAAQAPHAMLLAEAGLGNRELGIKPDIEGLHRDDGVSNYSAMYWKQAADKEGTTTGKKSQGSYVVENAVNETLSEIARREARGVNVYRGDQNFKMPDRFRKLGKAISEIYRKNPQEVKKFFYKKQQRAIAIGWDTHQR